MSYFRDLTPYTYFPLQTAELPDDAKALNIGWLWPDKPVPQGDVPLAFIRGLSVLFTKQVMQTRGWQSCPFCDSASGSAEVRAIGADGTVYCAPALVLHYVTVHCYEPPQEFIDAVAHTMKMAGIRFPKDGPDSIQLLREANELLDGAVRDMDAVSGQAPKEGRSHALQTWWDTHRGGA